jgi:hypothetical protein
MYYAVFTDNVIHYLGPDRHSASEIWTGHDRATLLPVTNLQDLRKALSRPEINDPFPEDAEDFILDDPFAPIDDDYREAVEEDTMSDAAAKLFTKLDELGLSPENVDNWSQSLKKNGDKVVAEVKSLGIKGMKAVGDSFQALGDLLKQEAKKTARRQYDPDAELWDELDRLADDELTDED